MGSLDVLVVGAGPTGLTLAGEVLRRGARARVVDKAAAPTTQSRAIGVHARTLEILDDFGVADELVARGNAVDGATMRANGAPLLEVDFTGLPTRFPFILCAPQHETESVLAALLARRGGAVERGTELTSLAQDAAGVDAVLRTGEREERVRAAYLVGCDGAHSAVRHAVGAAFEGHTYEETFFLADVRIAWDEPPRRVLTFVTAEGAVAFFPLKDARWRIVVTAADALGESPSLDAVRALVERRVGRAVPLEDAGWRTPFRIHCRQVERYRHGRVFLAGDAAHIHSPIGGQGMNTGIQDAHNLAWKLAMVQRAHARASILDSYQSERHAIAKNVLRQTDLATKVGTLTGPLVPLRNHLARFVTGFAAVRAQIAREASELAVAYESSPLVGEHAAARFPVRTGPAPGARAPDADVLREGDAAPARLARAWDARAFTVLLFEGTGASDEVAARLAEIARRALARFGARVAPFVVTARAERPRAIPVEIPVLRDARGDLASRYGAKTECLYVVRPDLYVSFRSHPADGDALEEHLARMLL